MLEIDRSEWLASAFLSNTHRQGLHHTRVRQPCRKLDQKPKVQHPPIVRDQYAIVFVAINACQACGRA